MSISRSYDRIDTDDPNCDGLDPVGPVDPDPPVDPESPLTEQPAVDDPGTRSTSVTNAAPPEVVIDPRFTG